MIATGIHVPLVTPVDAAGAVSRADVASMVSYLRPYVDSLVPALSTGEGELLDDQQWHDMVAATVKYADGLPVYAGALSPTTAGVIERAVEAGRLGAAAVVASTPFGMDVSQQQMYQHYARIYAESPIPVVVYDEVDQSGNELALDTLLSICRLPGVLAVKDSQGDSEHWARLLAAKPPVALWLGREELVGELGPADGALLAIANLTPELCQRWWQEPTAEIAGQLLEACQQSNLFDADWYLHVKRALRAAGQIANDRPVGTVRMP